MGVPTRDGNHDNNNTTSNIKHGSGRNKNNNNDIVVLCLPRRMYLPVMRWERMGRDGSASVGQESGGVLFGITFAFCLL